MKEALTPKKNIIILGAGFGGLKCALELEKLIKKFPVPLFDYFNIILIDKNSYHTYTPSLYETATTHKESADAIGLKKASTIPIDMIIGEKNINFYQTAVKTIDFKRKQINLGENTALPFEYLVLALGSKPSFFGITGAENFAIPLKSLKDAVKIRSALENIFSSEYPGKNPSILVAGAGSTGVEFAGELSCFIKKTNKIHQRTFYPEITLVDKAENVLSGFDKKIIAKAQKRLEKLGISFMFGKMIKEVKKNEIILQSKSGEETVEYDLLVWTTGVTSNIIPSDVDFSKEKSGIAANKCLCCESTELDLEVKEKIFVIGDNACFLDQKTNGAVPATAKIAIEQGKTAAKNIVLDIFKKPKKEFKVKSWPYIIPIGGKYAICKIKNLKIGGIFGWVLKMLVELRYLLSIMDFKKAFKYWVGGLKIFIKND